jgi:hypothetical protein
VGLLLPALLVGDVGDPGVVDVLVPDGPEAGGRLGDGTVVEAPR